MRRTAQRGTLEPGPQLPGRPNTRKWLIGCAVAFAAFLVFCVGTAYIGAWYAQRQMNKMIGDFQQKGFQQVKGQQINVTQPITGKTLYFGQVVKIDADSATDLAIFAQQADINGKVNGTLYFRGQTLNVAKGASVTGDLDVLGQVINLYGTVGGQVKGRYQQLNNQGTVGGAARPSLESTGLESTGVAPAAPATVQSTAVQST